MAVGGLLALLDDVTALTKIATKKVSGVVGDDLALNAKAMVGIAQDREIPLIKQVAIGSLKNKAILIPAALLLAVFAPVVMQGLLMLGGAYLCYEGVEKLLHHKEQKAAEKDGTEANLEDIAPAAGSLLEKQKVKAAVQTDLILSAEIVVIALGQMTGQPVVTQALTLGVLGFGMTAGVYTAVAGLLRADNVGLSLMEAKGDGAGAKFKRGLGQGIVKTIPYVMKALSVGGTLAMFSVGGGILLHAVPALAHAVEGFGFIGSVAATAVAGVIAGYACVKAVVPLQKPARVLMEKISTQVAKLRARFSPAPKATAPQNTAERTADAGSPLDQAQSPREAVNNAGKKSPAETTPADEPARNAAPTQKNDPAPR